MNATMTRLNRLTVKVLREIAAQMGVKLLSRDTKPTIVGILFNHIESAHVVALMTNETYPASRQLTRVVPTDFPALTGEVVTEAHSKICKTRGHANYSKNGVQADFCPRCGDMLDLPEVTKSEVSDSDEKAFDSLGTLQTLIASMAPLAKQAEKAFEASITGPVRDMHYQAYKDLTNAIEEMQRTLAFFDSAEEHNCDYHLIEVGMSGCQYGCKIYRCTKCESPEDVILHNPTYGCRTPNV